MMAKKKISLFDEHNYKIVLQQLAELEFIDTDLSSLEFKGFSTSKEMFEYQIEALQNAFRVLLKYFNDFKADKEEFYKTYKKYPHANLDYTKPSELLLEYFESTGKRVEFSKLINRMGFWMTMGSGKTIVIIKLIELLDSAMNLGLIPKKNIMFFTANENLLERFKKEVEEYNLLKSRTIDTISLKDYEERQTQGTIFDSQVIKLFCYRSDLLNEERKENILDFKDYLDGGDNYIILDEAHKGDKEDSKRQQIFSILSQNGFLFNFSATFTDERDIATTVYNLNQAVWVQKGYGKKLFLLDNDLKAFKNKTDLNENEKQKSLIKSLILLAYAKEHKQNLKNMYHEPMMVVFTNSVNTDDADAKLFFRQLNLFINNYDDTIFKKAIQEIKDEFKHTNYLVTDKSGEMINEFANELDNITYDSLKLSIFYAKTGNIEAIINPKEKGEIAFKLDSSDKPFGLLKIGDISSWKNDELDGFKIVDTFKDDGYFKSLNDSSINILIGSRSFYEGWDTTRPNIMLFLNIGMDKDAKKFVTQSIGRGMRVESVNGNRQRISYIDIDIDNKSAIQKDAQTLETLFIISTNKEAIQSIIEWQEEQNKGIDWVECSLKKTDTKDKILYIPTYKQNKIKSSTLSNKKSFKLSKVNKEQLEFYLNSIPKEIFALRHQFFNKNECDEFYKWINSSNSLFVDNNIHYKSLDMMIDKMKQRVYLNKSDIDSFKILQDEIIHFQKIKVRADKKDEFDTYIKKSLESQNLTDEEVFLKSKEEGISLSDAMKKYQVDVLELDNTKFRKLSQHYYNPVITSENNDWLKNIISNESEIIFLDELCSITDNLDKQFDWWMFSRINEHYDKKVYIPYIENGMEKPFYPDFIFWLQKDDNQTILFFDPKGVKFTDYEHKVDGYKEIYESKSFNKNNTKIEVKLAFYKISEASGGKEYAKYWVSKDELKNYILGLV